MLPPELFSLVFENLLDDQALRTLSNCCLLTRDFRHPCQRLLLKKLTLTDRPGKGEAKIQLIERATAENASLATYVQELYFYVGNIPTDGYAALVLSRLNNITKLSIEYKSGRRSDYSSLLPWSALPTPLRTVLERMISSPQLSMLQVYRMDLPLRRRILPSLGVNVEEIFLPGTEDGEVGEGSSIGMLPPPNPPRSIQPRILRLCFRIISTFLESPRVDWTQVHTLVILLPFPEPLATTDIQMLQALFSRCTNLRELDISPNGEIGDLTTIFLTASNQIYSSLKALRLSLVWDDYRNGQDPYMGILSALSTFPPNNSLETFRLFVVFRLEDGLRGEYNKADWTRFTTVLTRAAFPSLRELEIEMFIFFHCDDEMVINAMVKDLEDMSWGDMAKIPKFKFEVDASESLDD